MKYLLLTIIACMFYFTLLAQKLTTETLAGTSSLYETYIKKSQRKLKAARTLKYTAIGSAVTSGIFFLIAANKSKNNANEMFSGLVEGIVGFGFGAIAVGSGLTSLFLSSSAKKYKKAALSLKPVVKVQSVSVPGLAIRNQAVGSIVLSF
ncbi:hypothetical protein [Niabella hibiscisoli]|uniref:hypothetical protein n=1 Tax=Niabella hibiscisoli TaxID=1825928 RepID=UPI001F10D072|nr:hypothetical protein [Niabella hibiscisoli]MCH5720648.1 hypothetical protein [Niabella hibiscisoli]